MVCNAFELAVATAVEPAADGQRRRRGDRCDSSERRGGCFVAAASRVRPGAEDHCRGDRADAELGDQRWGDSIASMRA